MQAKRIGTKRYYGDAMTLEEIAKTLGITRERVRQIERQALRKLKSPCVAQRLKVYMEE